MDISSLYQTSAQPSSQPVNRFDILDSLRLLGGINATVVRIAKGEVLLATRLGEIIGKNPLDLKAGDQVRIRVGGQDSKPVLKISQVPVERIILNASRHQAALSRALAPNQPQTAVVVTQKTHSTDIRLNGNQYSINQQVELKTGQLISLLYRPDKSQIEIKPVNAEQILKTALARLLPQVMQAGSNNSLVSLVKIMRSLVAQQPPATPSNGTTAEGSASFKQEGVQPRLMTRFLSILQSMPSLSSLDKTVIQQWAEFIGSVKTAQGVGNSTLVNPFSLLKQLPTDEAGLRPLLQQWARQISTSPQLPVHSAPNTESLDKESYSNVAKDILKLVEQSLNQLQFQQVTVRYQQELQQPINLSLTIPLTEDQSTKPLQLKIRENKSSTTSENSAWDIDLSFEFGALGLISSHINLDGNRISTTFWASQEDTKLKIDRALPEFEQQLVSSGFDLGQFLSLAGSPPATKVQDRPSYPDSLLDIRV